MDADHSPADGSAPVRADEPRRLCGARRFRRVLSYDIVVYDAAKFDRLCTQARSYGILCAPSVGPGYDAAAATGDTHVKDRAERRDLRLDVEGSAPSRRGPRHDHVVQRVGRGDADRARGPRREVRELRRRLRTSRARSRAAYIRRTRVLDVTLLGTRPPRSRRRAPRRRPRRREARDGRDRPGRRPTPRGRASLHLRRRRSREASRWR